MLKSLVVSTPRAVASLVLTLALLCGGPALAQGPDAKVRVTVIHATKDGTSVAPDLGDLAKYLVKSFAPYTAFKTLDRQQVTLAAGASSKLALPNGSELIYRNDGRANGFVALHLEVGGLKTTVNVKDGGTFFQAGRSYEGGMIVLAFAVDP